MNISDLMFIFTKTMNDNDERTFDSCNVNLPLKLVVIKFSIYPRNSLEICSFQLPIARHKLIF